MKAQQNLPPIGEQLGVPNHWPSVSVDHNLPLHHARTEAAIGAGLALALIFGAFVVFDVRIIRLWGMALFVVGIMFLPVCLLCGCASVRRYCYS